MLLFYVRKHSTVVRLLTSKATKSLSTVFAVAWCKQPPYHRIPFQWVSRHLSRDWYALGYQRDVRGRNLTQSDLTSASKPLNWSTVKGKPHWGWRSVRQGVGSPFAYQSSLIFNDLNKGLIPFLGKDFEEHLFKRTTVQRNLPRPIDSNRSDEALIKA